MLFWQQALQAGRSQLSWFCRCNCLVDSPLTQYCQSNVLNYTFRIILFKTGGGVSKFHSRFEGTAEWSLSTRAWGVSSAAAVYLMGSQHPFGLSCCRSWAVLHYLSDQFLALWGFALWSQESPVLKSSSGIFAGGEVIASGLVFSLLICWRWGSEKSGWYFLVKNPSVVAGGRSLCSGEIMQQLQEWERVRVVSCFG